MKIVKPKSILINTESKPNVKRIDVPERVPLQQSRIRYEIIIMSKITDTLRGKGIAGQILYGIIDFVNVPNLLNIYRSVKKNTPGLSGKETMVAVLHKLDKIRLLTALTLLAGMIYGMVTGEIPQWLVEKFPVE